MTLEGDRLDEDITTSTLDGVLDEVLEGCMENPMRELVEAFGE
jgi:hypothetical protein